MTKKTTLLLNDLDKFITDLMETYEAPGLSVGIVLNGEVIFTKGYGKRNITQNETVNEETVFPIGSATKAFTSMAIGILVDEGVLEWDKPVREYIPEFRLYDAVASERLTLRDLACHRTGLPRYDAMLIFNPPATREGILKKLRHLKPTKDMRSYWQYNNAMYAMLGLVVEKVTGKTWEEFVGKRILKPLGMSKSNFFVEEMLQMPNYAAAHKKAHGRVEPAPHIPIGATGPAGSINSNISDMLKWVQLHLNKGIWDGKQLINKRNLQQMHSPQMVIEREPASEEFSFRSYGLGWFIEHYRGNLVVHHGGATLGCESLVTFMPKQNIGVVLLCNRLSLLPNAISYGIYDRLLELQPIDWNARRKEKLAKESKLREESNNSETQTDQVDDASPSRALRDYTGRYKHRGMGSIEIVRADDDTLKATYGMLELSLTHVHYDVFQGELPEEMDSMKMRLTFLGDSHGKISSLSIPLGWDPLVEDLMFEKETEIDTALMKKLAGEYEIAGMSLCVNVAKDNVLTASMPGQPTITLEPISNLKFSFKGLPGYSIEFNPDKSTDAIELKLYQPNGTFIGKKK